MNEIWSKAYIGLHVKYPLFLPDFNEISVFSTLFRKIQTINTHTRQMNALCGQYAALCLSERQIRLVRTQSNDTALKGQSVQVLLGMYINGSVAYCLSWGSCSVGNPSKSDTVTPTAVAPERRNFRSSLHAIKPPNLKTCREGPHRLPSLQCGLIKSKKYY